MNRFRYVNVGLIIIFIISVLPLLIMGGFARPLWDDYQSTIFLHKSLMNNDIVRTLISPFYMILYMYLGWQGTYSAEFIFALQPGAWPLPAYWLTPFILIVSISASYIYLGKVLVRDIFGCSKDYGVILMLPLLILQFQYVPYIHQAFYWYNGAMYYGFFMALFLFEIALIIELLSKNETTTKRRLFAVCFLAFFISGGNYSTALIQIMILVMMSVYFFVNHNEKHFRLLLLITLVAAIGLIISAVAPGNLIRASESTQMAPIAAIIKSIIKAFKYIFRWTRLPQIGMLIFLIPVIYFICKETKFTFRYPIIAITIMFGLFAAQITPPYYALSYEGAERQINMYYYSYYLFITACLFYLEGWVIKRIKISDVSNKLVRNISIAGIVIVFIGIVISGVKGLNSYEVAADIFKDRAKQYAIEYDNAIDQINSQGDVCYVEEIKQWTHSLDKLYIDEDPEYWVNIAMASYFDKDKIYLKK